MFPMLAVDNRTWGATEYSAELLALSRTGRGEAAAARAAGRATWRRSRRHAAEHLGVSPRAIVTGATIDSVTSGVGTGAIDAASCGLIIGTTSVMATHVCRPSATTERTR